MIGCYNTRDRLIMAHWQLCIHIYFLDLLADESQLSTAIELNKEILAFKSLGRRAHPNVISMLGISFIDDSGK